MLQHVEQQDGIERFVGERQAIGATAQEREGRVAAPGGGRIAGVILQADDERPSPCPPSAPTDRGGDTRRAEAERRAGVEDADGVRRQPGGAAVPARHQAPVPDIAPITCHLRRTAGPSR